MRTKLSASQKIVRSLFRLLEKQPYQTIRVKQICRAAKISRMTFYRHFRSKTAVVNYSFDVDFTIFIQRVASSHFPTFNRIATIFFTLIKQRQARMELIFKNRLADLLLDRLEYYLSELIDQRVLQTRERSSKLLIAMIAGGLTEVLATWIRGGMKMPVASLVIFSSKYMHFKI